MFCEELLLPSLSPFSICTLACYTGGREGTCEVKEVKAGVEEMVVDFPSLPRRHYWGWTPPCWRPRGGRQRDSLSLPAAASAVQVLMRVRSLSCGIYQRGSSSHFQIWKNFRIGHTWKLSQSFQLLLQQKRVHFARHQKLRLQFCSSQTRLFFLHSFSKQMEFSSSSSLLREQLLPPHWCPSGRRSCSQGTRQRRRSATCWTMSGKSPDIATKVQHFLYPQRPFSQNTSESENNLESI